MEQSPDFSWNVYRFFVSAVRLITRLETPADQHTFLKDGRQAVGHIDCKNVIILQLQHVPKCPDDLLPIYVVDNLKNFLILHSFPHQGVFPPLLLKMRPIKKTLCYMLIIS